MTTNDEQKSTTSMRDVSFAVVDFETTGINPETDRVIQVAAIVINGEGEIVESFDTVVRPESPDEYTHGAEHVHGISVEQVAQGMPLREALEKLWTISEGNVFTAHNAKFDINFLHAESERVGLENKIDTYVDTLALARRTDQERTRKHSLHALCEHYGINHENAHEAKSDATATAELLIHLMREMDVQQPDQLPDLFS
jgi:DNA polymerase III subunit epsilon